MKNIKIEKFEAYEYFQYSTKTNIFNVQKYSSDYTWPSVSQEIMSLL